MGRSWKDVKADKEAIDRAGGRDVEAARATARGRTQAYVLGFRLAELRKKVGLTQVDVAKHMDVSQARISQLEQGEVDQLEVDTVRRYITALGGSLKIVADIDGEAVTLATSQVA
ncbi:helix-turn-helix domain-containing protein [Lentzea flaviverrucosa]|uniref:Helix-turn-helix domain-containing protein n=1 Tax=Lentzea flaviverrucosa TaxID=200379 RepID=A0A1H9XI05_9PSEU|nr:XRE family transcriptional regulator [Lentzea flaviverrucosa]RDI20171.1 helix-turn-helix protein [Lentzea flaviverrucosa]SES45671.1 Helix-turn-helix domain-containing protein [Lentzea flaviverrucosa]